MKTPLPLLLALMLVPAAWAQNGNGNGNVNSNGIGNGPGTPPPGQVKSTIPSDAELDRFGLVKPSEAGPLLAQYDAQEKQLLAQRQAAYEAMQGRSEEDQIKIWRAMIEDQKALLAEHRALEKRLSAALKDQREKAGNAEKNAKAVETR